MNRTIRILIAVLAFALLGTVGALAEDRIATIDLRVVFDGYWKTKQANDALKERGVELEAELEGLVEDFKVATDDYKTLLESANDPRFCAPFRQLVHHFAESRQTVTHHQIVLNILVGIDIADRLRVSGLDTRQQCDNLLLV